MTNLFEQLGFDSSITYDKWTGPKTYEDIEARLLHIVGRQYKDLINGTATTRPGDKGSLGNIVQSRVFGISPNSLELPDYGEYGEGKVTGYRLRKDGLLVPKERLVMNIVNYHREAQVEKFEQTSLFLKNRKILLSMHEYIPNTKSEDFRLIGYGVINMEDFPADIKEQIATDAMDVVQMIKDGQAHKLSGRMGKFIEVCPKGANRASSSVSQPNSTQPAQQRAWAFKARFLKELERIGKIKIERNLMLLPKTDNPANTGVQKSKLLTDTHTSSPVSQVIDQL